MAIRKQHADARLRAEAPRAFTLAEVLESLCLSREPVSYYDCHVVVRRLQREHRNPEPELLTHVAALHDYSLTTDGGRQIIAHYVQGLLLRFAQERMLGNSPLSLRANGKTVRLTLDSTLRIHLEERRSQGYRWALETPQLQTLRLSMRRDRDDLGNPGLAVFSGKANRIGTQRVAFNETPPLRSRPQDVDPQRMEVTVVVEPKQQTLG